MADRSVITFTKYEKARIIGARALQLAQGAPFLAKLSKKQIEDFKYNPVEIAKYEFDQGVIPMEVRRIVPDVTTPKEAPKAAKTEEAAEE